jgi:hypothetical protein
MYIFPAAFIAPWQVLSLQAYTMANQALKVLVELIVYLCLTFQLAAHQ